MGESRHRYSSNCWRKCIDERKRMRSISRTITSSTFETQYTGFCRVYRNNSTSLLTIPRFSTDWFRSVDYLTRCQLFFQSFQHRPTRFDTLRNNRSNCGRNYAGSGPVGGHKYQVRSSVQGLLPHHQYTHFSFNLLFVQPWPQLPVLNLLTPTGN